MAQTYIQIQQQIASLQRRAETLRLDEVKSAIGKAKAIISRFALTAEQLGLTAVNARTSPAPVTVNAKAPASVVRKATKPARPVAVPAKKAAAPVVKKAVAPAAKKIKAPVAKKAVPLIRYRDDAANTWGGRGPKPKWLVAGIAAGRTLESFAAGK